jgi:hypothetical protein
MKLRMVQLFFRMVLHPTVREVPDWKVGEG